MSDPPPETATFNAAALEEGRLLFARECTFLKGVVGIDHLPPPDRVEFAFAGRSNVGKSSLLNALTGRKNLARTSNTPGRTQEINFFSLGDDSLYLVDMPGYGYARTSKSKVQAWTQLIKDYLRGRVALRRVFVLIDARHGIKPNDTEILELLDTSAVSYQIVLTKADKVRGGGLDALLGNITVQLKKHPAAYPEPLLTSSVKGTGIPGLRATIVQIIKS